MFELAFCNIRYGLERTISLLYIAAFSHHRSTVAGFALALSVSTSYHVMASQIFPSRWTNFFLSGKIVWSKVSKKPCRSLACFYGIVKMFVCKAMFCLIAMFLYIYFIPFYFFVNILSLLISIFIETPAWCYVLTIAHEIPLRFSFEKSYFALWIQWGLCEAPNAEFKFPFLTHLCG